MTRQSGSVVLAGRSAEPHPGRSNLDGTDDFDVEAPEFSEEHLAVAFAYQRCESVRYVAEWGQWLILGGHKWVPDRTLKTTYDVRVLCRDMAVRCAVEGKFKLADDLASARTVANVERLARSDRLLAATTDQWDRDPLLLNTPEGVVDLRAWRERAADASDYFTKSTAVAPAPPGSPCPMWQSFLATVMGGDAELISFLQRMCGYFLTGDTSAHALFFAYGTGANGKSVFVNTIAGILGDYATSAPMETFMAAKDDRHPTELADLRGARLVTATETEEGRRWAESRVKALTGGDPVKARFMRQDFFEFIPQFKLFIAGNHKPALRGVDEAIRRRFYLVPFDVTIPRVSRDPDLSAKLKAEWPAILRWMIEGYEMFSEAGLQPPEAVRAATAEYLAAEDAFSLWFEESCDAAFDGFETTSDLYASWKRWADRAGEFAGSAKRFSQTMAAHGYVWERRMHGRGFRGVWLKQRTTSGLVS